ncbi:hypothetical protein R5R35_005037 [Gryllus longicercus]|uniref:Uncharacterized protein n=1 Tax=Gryllus longicercus TaxID=2509291 RepID=A0AAN9VXT9_9ORTH
MLQMEETGLIRKWKDDFNTSFGLAARLGELPKTTLRVQQSYDAANVLALNVVVCHLQLLCAGLSASALAFCAELWRGHGAGQRLRRRSRLVRAQLSRMCAGVRHVGAQILEFGLRAIAQPSPSQP